MADFFNRSQNLRLLFSFLSIFCFFAGSACDSPPEIKDDRISLVRTPEILSVTLHPPAVVVGEAVRGRYLLADRNGALEPSGQAWILTPSGAEVFPMPSGMSAESKTNPSGRSQDVILSDSPEFQFNVPSWPSGETPFSSEFRASVGLLIFPENLAEDLGQNPWDSPDLESLLFADEVLLATRTLTVADLPSTSRNPGISGIFVQLGTEGAQEPVTFFTSNEEDLEEKRQIAADRPYVHSFCNIEFRKDLYFTVVPESGDNPFDLEYQWVSTGGDFISKKDNGTRWSPPYYTFWTDLDSPSDEEAEGVGRKGATSPVCTETQISIDHESYWTEGIEPRRDVNLYPVWLILRSRSGDYQGQTWAEFYIRIVI